MAVPWEPWVLLWLAGFQWVAAWWWWRGPALPGTRGWGASLFLLNGVATVGEASRLLGFLPLKHVGDLVDLWTGLFLVGFGLAAFPPLARRARVQAVILGAVAAALLALSAMVIGLPHPGGIPAIGDLVDWPLGTAMALTGLGLVLRSRHADDVTQRAWILVLAAFSMRWMELGVAFTGHFASQAASGFPDGILQFPPRLAGVAALALGLVALTRPRPRSLSGVPRDMLLIALLMMAGGILTGVIRFPLQGTSASWAFFTLALVRPGALVVAQAHLDGREALRSRRGGAVVVGALPFGVSVAGLAVAGGPWGMADLPAALVAALMALLTVPLAASLWRRWPVRGPPSHQSPAGAGAALEADRVPLPEDWRDRVSAARRAHDALPSDVRERLARLARWQRIILALDGAPTGAGPLHPYERTTPGLHLATHCPYALIGPEIARANRRAGAILAELGIRSARGGPPLAPLALIVSNWGTAEGLRSRRARIHELTPLGREVAARLREGLGLAHGARQDVARFVGEQWGAAR